MNEKLCWFCQHFGYSQAEVGYSELTPGSDFYICCYKNHWTFDAYETTQQQFGKMLQNAQSCPDFVLLEDLRKK